jgi:ATP-binding cassette, subfamily B, multidrug efflux pump
MKNDYKTPPRSGHRGHGPGFSIPVEKAKDFKGTLKRLLVYLSPYKVQLIFIFITAILSVVFNILSPKILGLATTKIFEGVMMKINNVPGASIDFNYIGNILLYLAALYLFSALFQYIQHYLMASVSQNTVYNMRKDIDEKLTNLPLKYFDTEAHGDILSRVSNDIDNISASLQYSVNQLISSLVTLLGVLIMMLSINLWMTLIIMLTLPLYLFFTKPIIKRSQKYFANRQRVLGKLNAHIEENITAHVVVKAFVKEDDNIKEFSKLNESLYEAGWRSQFISGIIMPLMTAINNLGYVLISVTGAIFVNKGTIQIGDVQAFIQYSRQFTHPIQQTANIANILQSTIASAERIFEILNAKNEIPDNQNAKTIESVKGEVQFNNVSFGYSSKEKVIKNLSIDINPGQTAAIVGPTGAGKTTLVNLLMRFYEIDEGKILIDGVNITDLTRLNLRSIFGMVLQDTWLFNGTIKDNIAYGYEDATDKEIIKAARTAYVDHFIRTLPDGYETIINEEASNISQGQKQLLTIARAILSNPSILILDEATSSVDTRTEILIQKAMDSLMEGKTSFVIAHRLSTIRNADIILVMNEGRIIEKGKHHQLLEKDGFYVELYNSQFTGGHLI